MRIRGILLIGGCFFLVGLGTTVFGLASLWRAHQSLDWPRAAGTIEHSTMESDTRNVSDDHSRPNDQTVYYPNVEYSYSAKFRTNSSCFR